MPTYEKALASLRSIPWHLAPEVTPISPRPFKHLEFFPGRKGFSGADLPSRGVMIVGNNYDNLDGWKRERDEEDVSRTWKRLKEITIPQSLIPLERFWFTNYCHGVMEKASSRYEFPSRVRKVLEFQRVFEECVMAMKPTVIVALGGAAKRYLHFTRGEAQARVIAGHSTKALAMYHTAAGGRTEKFSIDALRLHRAHVASAS